MTVLVSSTAMAVRTLCVRVVEGPDAGRSHTASHETFAVGSVRGNDLVLTDPTVSRFHVELQGTPAGVLVTDCGSSNGTYVGTVRIERATVAPGTALRLGRTTLQVDDAERVQVPLHGAESMDGLDGVSEVMRRLMAQIATIAPSDVSVLILGESGTGKELVARALHAQSPRAKGPFVTVDCGALAPTLAPSELFGHERGAFTGADQSRRGAFELADGGTVFLDELGELSPAVQAMLLGVIERGRFRRVGSERERTTDVRVVSATNRELRKQINASAFRLDLYHRLAGVVTRVPPLRDRKEDIPLLVEKLLREFGDERALDDVFDRTALAAFENYSWPGNVRELRNAVEHVLATRATPTLGVTASSGRDGDDSIEALLRVPFREARERLLSSFERRYLDELLVRARGNLSHAARLARVHRSYLFELARKHKLR